MAQSPFTHVNLLDVDDSAPGFGLEDVQTARFATESLHAERTGLGHQRIAPDTRSPLAHRHEQAEEVYVVLAGSGRMRLDDEIIELAARDAVRVQPAVVRAFEAGPDGLEILAVGARHEGDGALVEGFWTD